MNPITLLQELIRFDTTNPPGNEAACVHFIQGLLDEAGVETAVYAKDPSRPNLIARLPGQGKAAPLLLYGHVDVVPTAGQTWTHPPFAGEIHDGCVWGRGTLDMKGGVAMMVSALLRAKTDGFVPAGDIVLAILSDEEVGGEFGAQYLVENHADEFAGIRYAIGEFGGFPMYVGGKKFYAIQVAEKNVCWLKATVRGPGGHGSFPMRGGAMAKMGKFLQKMDENRLPVHVTAVAQQMLQTMADATSGPISVALTQLLDPAQTDRVLDAMGSSGLMFDAILHNMANPTVIRGGHKTNVIPSEVSVELDGRLLPGFEPEDLIAELQALAGEDVEIELLMPTTGPPEPDMGLFNTLASILKEADPAGTSVPLLMMGSTDARHFSQIGIQTYGFLPMDLPEEFLLFQYIHAADERIPTDALRFGTDAIYKALLSYGQ